MTRIVLQKKPERNRSLRLFYWLIQCKSGLKGALPLMYYYENHNEWEKKLTRDIVTSHKYILEEALNLDGTDKIIVEFQKNRYQKSGDVDLAILKSASSGTQEIIAVELKVIHLNKKGEWESEKQKKHNKQISVLMKEGWDYVYFFDFIVTKEEPTFIHSQSFEIQSLF